nr:amidohydrolase family protein [Kibdelosporangium sp. MJ126-NF4]CEL13341.1 2-amino-3-carboxymuconate-6-semialdehyde decarboxylase [Kibdelosporangium sp. MJ126-NF4]CTQ99032.1 2-amino-3-carboxymuconate-6-semialdehyde decarboxylase [Kibdelosporangium sp. MJ126-NF4]
MTVNRRTLLAASTTAATVVATGIPASAAQSGSIDVHAHCLPNGLIPALKAQGTAYDIEVIESGGETRIRLGSATAGPLDPRLSDLSARVETMNRTGVERQLLSPFIGLTAYHLPDPAAAWYSRLHNETMAHTARTSPHRFTPMATVPLQSVSAASELVYAVEQLGMTGVEISTDTGAGQLDDDRMEPFWEAAENLRAPILIHPSAAARTPLPYRLANFVGNPSDTTVAIARLMFGGVMDRHPNLRICLVHGGGFLPYQAGRLERGFRFYGGDKIRTSPLELLRRIYHDTILHSPARVRDLVDLVGIDRVVLGTDYPFDMGDQDPRGTLAGIPGLRDRDRARIARENAERLIRR